MGKDNNESNLANLNFNQLVNNTHLDQIQNDFNTSPIDDDRPTLKKITQAVTFSELSGVQN